MKVIHFTHGATGAKADSPLVADLVVQQWQKER